MSDIFLFITRGNLWCTNYFAGPDELEVRSESLKESVRYDLFSQCSSFGTLNATDKTPAKCISDIPKLIVLHEILLF